MSWTAKDVLKFLPHRYPFLLIDRILEQQFQQYARCQKNISYGEEVFVGHFKENPIYPGVLMIEMALQTTQIMLTDLTAQNSEAKNGYAVSVDKFKFKQVVRPGDVLLIESRINIKTGELIRADIEIKNEKQELVAEGLVTVTA